MALQLETTAPSATDQKRRSKFALTLPSRERSITSNDRMFFTEQLALLLETGENLHGALSELSNQTQNSAMRKIVDRLATDVGEGKSFGHALSQHEAIFSSTYVNLISASEDGGFIHQVLQQLLEMDRKRDELRNTLISAASYPLFLIAFSIAVVAFVLIVVFPKFGTMFTSIYDQLPATTKTLMAVSDVMRNNWVILLTIAAGTAIGARQWLVSSNGRLTMDRLKLRVPVVRDIFTQIYLVQSLQVLSLSLGNGVSVMESLEACRDVVRNSVFRQFIRGVEEKVQEGAGVASGFDAATFVPSLAKHMIATGEQTGNLAKVMGRIAEYYETQLTKRLTALSKLAEPMMLLVMGVVVGILVSSLILPIFKLSRAVS